MAYAYLNEEPLRGVEGKCYRVDADPFGAAPFGGRPDRDWDEFEVSEGDGSFAYRTGPDRIREFVQAIVAGRRTVDQARQDPRFNQWYRKLEEEYDASYGNDRQGARDAVLEVLADIASEKICASDLEKPWSFYLFESEKFLHEPLELLPLPPWAKHEYVMDGGPGSGFDAAFLILDPGKTLEDLAAWLEGQGPEPQV